MAVPVGISTNSAHPHQLPTKERSGKKRGRAYRGTHMDFQSPQLFNSLDPHPLEDLSGLHGLWRLSNQTTAYIPGCSPIAITPRGYVRADTIVAHIPSKSCCHLSVTHPYSRDAKRFEKHHLWGEKKAVWICNALLAFFSSLSPVPGNQRTGVNIPFRHVKWFNMQVEIIK